MMPCVFTHKAGASNGVKARLDRDVTEGVSFNDFSFSIRELHAHRGMRLATQYANLDLARRTHARQRQVTEFFRPSTIVQPPPPPNPPTDPLPRLVQQACGRLTEEQWQQLSAVMHNTQIPESTRRKLLLDVAALVHGVEAVRQAVAAHAAGGQAAGQQVPVHQTGSQQASPGQAAGAQQAGGAHAAAQETVAAQVTQQEVDRQRSVGNAPFPPGLLSDARTAGGHYFSSLYLHSADSNARRDCFQQLISMTGAAHGVLKFDHCHKPAKSIRLPDATSRACIGTAWALNGHSEVLGYYQVC